jgi:hypothetical protein
MIGVNPFPLVDEVHERSVDVELLLLTLRRMLQSPDVVRVVLWIHAHCSRPTW